MNLKYCYFLKQEKVANKLYQIFVPSQEVNPRTLTHKRKRHPTEHVCHICGESFVGRHGLLMHKSKTHRWDQQPLVKEEPTPERFCAECDVQFDTTHAWQRHILTSVNHTLGGDGSQCKICHQRLSGESMSAHMREHEKSLRQTTLVARKLVKLACEQCDAYFVGRSNLRAHVRRVHLGLKYNRNVVCELCGKKCTVSYIRPHYNC
ncbi:zinc finger and BTB domain-containing protein 11-like [Manduca sexta]|uniref:zinc finger and BTB domain-containing protein 11-like n=1 Tax=Manduca sexta TaxID=7130 RepID=UPI0018900824|nr:zinc finger and BTB domain-containing protein 11-like [Manduca sexta]